MTRILIVPGWQDSGPGHWQSLWAQQLPGALRVLQDDWNAPSRSACVASISRTIREQHGPAVVVAHSLGCIATTHLPSEAAQRIQGALLVALADVAPAPHHALPYRSILVASKQRPLLPGAHGRRLRAGLGQRVCAAAKRRAHQRRIRLWPLAAGARAAAVPEG